MRKNEKRGNKKSSKTRRPVRMRLTNARGGDPEYMQLFEVADKHAVLGAYQMDAGTWQHPRTGLWQVWISTAGNDISWLSAWRDRSRAEQDVEAFKRFASTPDVYDPEKCAALFGQLAHAGDAEPESASAAEIMNLTRQIHEMVFDIRQQKESE